MADPSKEQQMRLVRTGSVVASITLAMTACAGDNDTADGDREITFWDTADPENEAPAFEEQIREFEEEHDIIVNHQTVPFDETQDMFKTAAESGEDAPDVLRSEVAWTAEFASLGLLAELDDTPALHNPDDFLEGPYSSTQYDGSTYAVPQVTDSLALLYNRDLLAEAGYEDPPETMAELTEVAISVSEDTDATGLYLNPEGYFLLPFLYAHGADLLDDQAEAVTVNEPAAVSGLEDVLDLIADGGAVEPDLAEGYDNMQGAFRDGDAAMILNGPWAIGDLMGGPQFEDDPDNLGVAALEAGAPVGGHNYAAYAGSADLDAAHEFIAFMASADTQQAISEELGLLPSRASVYEADGVADHEIISAFEPVMEAAQPRPWIPEAGQLFEPLDQAYEEALIGESTPQEALDDVAEAYQGFLPDWE
ncbi:extracellular solute-binding protein [Lipingzhangella sp. LS1_29]|uniref:Extracellular solute-binding protein n=1 Tax=Lipingzhangella rawalii TaxID=2055835 RepID=A0ABU2H1W2_9ACTN|nr:extracellular solute-binding protein [Lipingzhangella rawalii]MDS1269292.1 extracellular solute-binding protein [Lipingzhangella rawalii]